MKIGIFGNLHTEEIVVLSKKLFEISRKKDIALIIEKDLYDFLQTKHIEIPQSEIITSDDFHADVVISIGGDGTFLKTASRIGRKNIPILGVNTGRLGFLIDTSKEDFVKAIDLLLNGEYAVEERTALQLNCTDAHFCNDAFALNEVAVLKQDSNSMITLQTKVNGEYLTTYLADGLIISTPTGSTAYSMSVGGPLVVPQSKNLIISPVAPHSFNIRPLVIPDEWEIELKVESRSNSFLVALDGRSEIFHHSSKLRIKKADFTIKVVKRPEHSFFDSLRNKLLWGIDKRNNE
jgi:NAD+ kinase